MPAQIYPFENILHAASIAELSTALLHASQHFGFSSFHYGAHAPVKPNGDPARFIFDGTEQKHGGVISSYPESWFHRYQSQNYIEIDPLVRHCSRSIIPMVWHLQPEPKDRTVRQMFDEASEHGLLAGATFSVIGKNSELAIFSLTTDSNAASDKRNIQTQLGQGYMLLAHLHEAVTRLALTDNLFTRPVTLTPREKECLSWVSAGKTSWEIARILNVAEATVIFHISNAGKKLHTSTRTQTVARAITLGLIKP